MNQCRKIYLTKFKQNLLDFNWLIAFESSEFFFKGGESLPLKIGGHNGEGKI